MTALQSYYQKTLIVIFLLVICTPAIKMAISPTTRWSSTEKRTLAKLPTLPHSPSQLPSFFSQVDTYLSDHFGYRDILIYRYYREIKKRFSKTGLESRVILGQNGWYFFTKQNELEDYIGNLTLSQQKLTRWITERYRRAAWLKKRGIKYLLVIPPNKFSIYPEFQPKDIVPLKGISRFEQLLAYTKKSPMPFLVNLRQQFLNAKKDHQLFYKKDTHWNLRGAYIAFLEMTQAIQQKFPDIVLRKKFSFGPVVKRSCKDTPLACDLVRMAMQQGEEIESYPTLKKFPECAKPFNIARFNFSNLQHLQNASNFGESCEKRQLKAIVFRDSFFVALQPFFSENFNQVIYLWKSYDQANIEEVMKFFTPDIVIDETVERNAFN